jgi:hypothetical protein
MLCERRRQAFCASGAGRISVHDEREERGILMAKTKERVSQSAANVRPYVERALSDEELRENLREAFQAAKGAYSELISTKGTAAAKATKVATDKEIQESLRTAIEELRNAAERVRGGRQVHKSHKTSMLVSGIALGILLNPATGPSTRKWLRERIFGSGEEFEFPSGPEDKPV